MATRAQLFGRGLIEWEPLGLKEWSLIPFHAEPTHAIEDALHHIFGGALEIGVFNAQNEGAPRVAGKQPIEEGASARATYMQVAGRCRARNEREVFGEFLASLFRCYSGFHFDRRNR